VVHKKEKQVTAKRHLAIRIEISELLTEASIRLQNYEIAPCNFVYRWGFAGPYLLPYKARKSQSWNICV